AEARHKGRRRRRTPAVEGLEDDRARPGRGEGRLSRAAPRVRRLARQTPAAGGGLGGRDPHRDGHPGLNAVEARDFAGGEGAIPHRHLVEAGLDAEGAGRVGADPKDAPRRHRVIAHGVGAHRHAVEIGDAAVTVGGEDQVMPAAVGKARRRDLEHPPVAFDAPSDCGAVDGSVYLGLVDTSISYTLTLGDSSFYGNGLFTIGNLSAGSYPLTITDDSGWCTVAWPDTVTITAPYVVNVDTVIGYAGQNCDSANARIQVLPASPDLEYSYDSGANWTTTADTSGLENRLYTVGVRSVDYQNCAVFTDVDMSIGYAATIDWEVSWTDPTECRENTPRDLTLTTPTSDRLYSIDAGVNWSSNPQFDDLIGGDTITVTLAALDSSCVNYALDTLIVPTFDSLRISVDEQLAPNCPDSDEGILFVSDNRNGTMDVQYSWNTGNVLPEISNLQPGTYTVTATDGLCTTIDSFTLTEASGISFIIPQLQDTFVCGMPSVIYDFTEYTDLDFSWSSANGFSSQESYVEITESADYQLVISNENCSYAETISVGIGDSISAEDTTYFLLPQQAVINTVVRVIDVSNPIPDTVTWSFDDDVTEYIRSRDRSIFLRFNALGMQELGMEADRGGCLTFVNKAIEIVATEEELDVPPLPNQGGGVAIRDIVIYPNPTDNDIWASVVLTDVIPLLLVLDNNNGVELESWSATASDDHLVNMDLSAYPAGTYSLRVVAGTATRTLIIVKQ
ncbi:MAG: T9SS type A sorting domain-containing protein, partial [Bacteroidota bacterium]